MFVRNGQALGSVVFRDAPKAARPPKSTPKTEPQPEKAEPESQPEPKATAQAKTAATQSEKQGPSKEAK